MRKFIIIALALLGGAALPAHAQDYQAYKRACFQKVEAMTVQIKALSQHLRDYFPAVNKAGYEKVNNRPDLLPSPFREQWLALEKERKQVGEIRATFNRECPAGTFGWNQ